MKKAVLVVWMTFLIAVFLLPQAAAAAEPAITKAEVAAGVSFRKGLDTSSAFIRYLKKGEVVTVLSVPSSYWYQVRDAQGQVGYVSSSTKYISVVSNAKTIATVNFRTKPSADGSKVRLFPKGEELLVLEKINDSWYKARDLSGVVGYVSSGKTYLATDFSITGLIVPPQERTESVINAAAAYMGTPYEYGSARLNTKTFDCSDLIQQAFWDATRIMLPGDSQAQGNFVKARGPVKANWKDLKRGDLLFFMSSKGTKAANYAGVNKSKEAITHVGIYLGNGQILHTYSVASGGVRIDTIGGNAWEYRFLFGGSPIN
ncbi:C40 family peptidase [Paenibacillus eucommiae]|uniref:Cell wall-associated NlpC family hydrolase n=1 Tax=Paenibacillus eucommiae TaxID=1355755 RepID=A0ABS4IXF3_9BACL|nr:SH3 domain-containing C40 family peptidase [Paenibacillus eucommiae]MBP1991244.1 cell wall-associated NlpC family hydrolase [Paenibacillus eucommiae]